MIASQTVILYDVKILVSLYILIFNKAAVHLRSQSYLSYSMQMHLHDMTSEKYSIDAERNAVKPAVILEMKDGKPKYVTTIKP